MPNFKSNRDETVRLFENPVLEFFSHIHPATPMVVYLPLVVYMLYNAVEIQQNIYSIILLFITGVFIWTPFEYSVHRWLFHYEPKSDIGKKIHFLSHGIHHDYPKDKTRLVMPLLISVTLALIFYAVFYYSFAEYYSSLFAGFVFGYVCYDSIHYATHHFKMKGKIGRFLKEYHLRHHYNDSNSAFGVSNPLWDYVFATVPLKLKKIKLREN